MKHCTCKKGQGCTDTCDRGMNHWEIAIHEARQLPPSTRGQTLDWVLNRARQLQLTLHELTAYAPEKELVVIQEREK